MLVYQCYFIFRYCDVIPFDYDADISYLESDRSKLELSLKELKSMPDIWISSDITDVHYKSARVDVRGFKKVRKWTLTSLYHQVLGDVNVPSDFYLYQIIPNRHPVSVYIRNELFDKFEFSYVGSRKKTKFGNSCLYVVSDAMGLLKARYPMSLSVEMQTKGRCLGKFGVPPVCNQSHCP